MPALEEVSGGEEEIKGTKKSLDDVVMLLEQLHYLQNTKKNMVIVILLGLHIVLK